MELVVSQLAGEVPIARTVDATGMACPMPIIELAKAVDQSDVGDAIELLATDPAVKVDVPVWCRMQRQQLTSADELADHWRFVVRRIR